jgi:hypothetical protein
LAGSASPAICAAILAAGFARLPRRDNIVQEFINDDQNYPAFLALILILLFN